MGRAPCCDKANVKKGPWSPDEDAKLKAYIEQHGTGGNWIALPQKIGLKRCGKSCRLRWLNYLRPNIKHGGFTEEEENIICSLYINIGSRWSIIAAQLPGRTDNDIKNYWNTRLKKKLLAKQRKEQAAYRASLLEQEMKRESDNFMVNHQSLNQVPYFLDQPVAVPMMNPSQEIIASENQEHLTRLLMKIGGQFYEENHYQTLINSSNFQYSCSTQDQIYADSLNVVASTVTMDPVGPTSTQWMNTQYGTVNVLPELEDAVLRFEDAVVANGSASSGSAESTSWGGMNSLVYPSAISDFDACV